MYIHLGDKTLIKTTDIIAIIDKESCTFFNKYGAFFRQCKESLSLSKEKIFQIDHCDK